MPFNKYLLSGIRSVKNKIWMLVSFSFFLLFLVPAFAQTPAAVSKTTANLCFMGLFCNFRSFDQLIKALMRFMGFTILMASVIGIMVGGLFYIFSAGDESQAEKGKSIIIASVIGLSVFFLSYAIVTLVQSLLYGVGV